jgi:tetratricopeptide (TPR) repeat protein
MGKHLDRANILLDLHKYDLAEQEFRQEIVENPDSDLAHGSLARCLINQQRVGSETLTILEYALSLNPENDWLHYLLAVYWQIKCEFDRAQTAIDIAIQLDPDCTVYFDTLARILYDRGNDKFQTHSWRTLAIIFVVSRGVLWPISLGILAIGKGYWIRSYLQPVFTPLKKSLSLDPGYLSALNLQTHLLIKTNQFRPALASSLNAMQIDPNDHNAHKLHAQVLLRLGKYTTARDHFQSALRIDPSSAESKAGLLEAVRSQYRIYPWISITNWRGRLMLAIAFTIAVAIGIWMIWIDPSIISLVISTIFACLVFIPAIATSLAAKPIFNLFLQLNPRNKLLITSSIPIQNIIFGNYIAGLIITIISSTYLFTCLLLILDNKSAQAIVSSVMGIIGGVFISTVTFLPTIEHQRFRSLPVIYPLVVGGLGLVNILVYLSINQIGSLGQLFFWLVFLSPLFAIYSSKKY